MNTLTQRIERRLAHVLVATCLLFGSAVAHGDVVTDWNAVMQTTMAQVLQVRSATIRQVAAFEAVNAIAGDYEP